MSATTGNTAGPPIPKPPAGFQTCNVWNDSRRTQIVHLVRWVNGGTPGPTMCGRTRFDERDPGNGALLRPAGLAGWSMGGGVSGPGVGQERCADCWEPVCACGRRESMHAPDGGCSAFTQDEALWLRQNGCTDDQAPDTRPDGPQAQGGEHSPAGGDADLVAATHARRRAAAADALDPDRGPR